MRRLLAALFTTCVALSPAADAAEIEVLHWWTSGGEAKSAEVLKRMLEKQGHTWTEFAMKGGGGANAEASLKMRVAKGHAPAAAQVKGPAIQAWGDQGVLANIDDLAKEERWDSLLPPVISKVMKYKGSYVAVPVNVHRVNWMWVNPEVFAKAEASVPTTWDEFLVAAEKIKKAGFTPVAHGAQDWQEFTLFESIVLGVGGPGFYKKALVDLDQTALKSPTMEKSFVILRNVLKYTDKSIANRDWSVATEMLISGKAAMQFMGDWVKGEIVAANKVPGQEILCLPAPGTANAFTFNVDSFVLFKLASADARKGQLDLAKAIMSPSFQETFNLNKGSIPVRSRMDMSKFDACAKRSAQEFAAASDSGTLIPSIAHGMAVSRERREAMRDAVSNFARSQTMTPQDALLRLAAAANL